MVDAFHMVITLQRFNVMEDAFVRPGVDRSNEGMLHSPASVNLIAIAFYTVYVDQCKRQ